MSNYASFGRDKDKPYPVPTFTLGILGRRAGSMEETSSKYIFEKGSPSSTKRICSPGRSHARGESSGRGGCAASKSDRISSAVNAAASS